jgi:hypothetical protein
LTRGNKLGEEDKIIEDGSAIELAAALVQMTIKEKVSKSSTINDG